MAEFEKDILDELDEYEADIVDLDGESFEIIDAVTHENVNYFALVPYIEDLDDDEDTMEFIVLQEQEEDGETYLATVDDEDLYSEIGDIFLERFKEMVEDILE